MKNKLLHYHRYERQYWPKSKEPYYKCMEPGCPHYLTIATLAIGRESLCWGPNCHKLVVITKEDVARQLKKPMCEDCKQLRKEAREELTRI